MKAQSRYRSLDDFLATRPLTVDAEIDDGWGARVPVKGREIDATVLFADISGFTARTVDLDPTETLAFVNHFFTWITEEALRGGPGVIDKYIGDEVMLVFSGEFGSQRPLVDALWAARRMADNDVFAFFPHVGIASGTVIAGYVGTSMKQDCSVFGAPVALAARCADATPDTDVQYSSSITLPEAEWDDALFDDAFATIPVRQSDGTTDPGIQSWRALDPAPADLKNLGEVELRHVVREALWWPGQAPEDRAREAVRAIEQAGRRWKPAT